MVQRDGGVIGRRLVIRIVRRQTVLAQRAEDSAGRAAWFPRSFPSVACFRCRIPGIDKTCQGALENRPVMGASKPASGHGLDRNSHNNCDEST